MRTFLISDPMMSTPHMKLVQTGSSIKIEFTNATVIELADHQLFQDHLLTVLWIQNHGTLIG